MSDLPERLRRLYAWNGTNHVQEAADEIERLRAERDALFEVAQAIEGALRFAPAAEVLDEHSPIRDGLRAALALAKDAEARG